MGLFNKLGGKPKYPELQEDNPLANRMDQIKQPLNSLMAQVKDPIEVVPDGKQTYLFIGKPPKKFGIAWIEQGEIKNFQLVAKEKGMTPSEMLSWSEKLGSAYEQHQNDERFTAHVGKRDVVVTPSAGLAQKVDQIISTAMS